MAIYAPVAGIRLELLKRCRLLLLAAYLWPAAAPGAPPPIPGLGLPAVATAEETSVRVLRMMLESGNVERNKTLLKNFVGGLIILFERPFRVGDVLDVGGQRGAVTNIGLRASVLQLWDGTETLIPNSNLLENNLTNWTYSNHTVCSSVAASVAYGTDARRGLPLSG